MKREIILCDICYRELDKSIEGESIYYLPDLSLKVYKCIETQQLDTILSNNDLHDLDLCRVCAEKLSYLYKQFVTQLRG